MPGVTISARSDSCSALARSSGEPLYGTAPTSRAWLLMEQPGSWAADPMASGWSLGGVAEELTAISKRLGFRTLLLRRSAARTPQDTRLCFLVRSAPSGTWIRHLEIQSPGELLNLDFSVLAYDEPPDVGSECQPVYCVCTHGRRDPCCAEYGRRLMRRLNEIDDPSIQECVWESSHQGGHRFAANLACFPHGVFYGRVKPEEVEELLAAHAKGVISLSHYRGRSAFSRAAQAADHFLRSRLGVRGLDDLQLAGEEVVGSNVVEVAFAGMEGSRHRVEVRLSEGPLRRESCNKDKLTPVTDYEMRYLNG
ncbi:MAG: hypothetical protein KY393_01130 [Actinobacteria bacterium]|nr:hypothetical protein [Actinomycetota bacterium]